MGAFYGLKILNGEINSKTGNAWAMGDVPALWKEKTQAWIAEHVS